MGEDRPQPALERVQVHLRGRDRRRDRGRRPTARRSSSRCATPAPAFRPQSCRACSSASTASRARAAARIEGSGIGLALVQELVRLHGGTIAVGERGRRRQHLHRSPARWAPRTCRADRVHGRREQARRPALRRRRPMWRRRRAGSAMPSAGRRQHRRPRTAGPRPSCRAHGDEPRVLLADDNADMRDYVGGCCAPPATGSRRWPTARRRWRAARAHAAGPRALRRDDAAPRRLRPAGGAARDDATSDTPVILLSARAGEEAQVEGLRAGADDYLTKPFSARELLARVETNLHLARTRRETARLREEEAQCSKCSTASARPWRPSSISTGPCRSSPTPPPSCPARSSASFFYNVIDDKGESLHAVHALRRAARGVREISDAAQHRRVRADLRRRRASCAPTTSPRIRATATTRRITACRKGHLPVRSYLAAPVVSRIGRRPRRPVLRSSESRRVHRPRGAHDRRHRRAGERSRSTTRGSIAPRRTRSNGASRSKPRCARASRALEAHVRERTAELATANAQLVRRSRARTRRGASSTLSRA